MVEMAEKGEHADVVIMDPPRTGSDEAFLSSVVRLAPNKVVYVSCGPETLVRDLKYLTKHGYRMKECTPFDLFRLRNMWRRLFFFPNSVRSRMIILMWILMLLNWKVLQQRQRQPMKR